MKANETHSMKSNKVILRTRLVIFFCCVAFALLTFFHLQKVADPLTRYPYGTPEQRDQLAVLLDDEDINTLINMQLLPEEVLPYASVAEFNMDNIRYYQQIMAAQAADPQFVVYFVNTYRDRMDADRMSELLGWLSYTDLINYFESGSTLPLYHGRPDDLTAVLNGTETILRWEPGDLTEIAPGISLRYPAAASWLQMASDAAAAGHELKAVGGYMSQADQQQAQEYASYNQGPYGTREEQLGLSVRLSGFDEWNDVVSKEKGEDWSKACDDLSKEQKSTLDWLSENSWKYGWVFRYPQQKEEKTGVKWQPFVLRYVGQDAASELFEKGEVLEELK